ncbi:N-acetyl-1-D-myo-inositol-2-amino-2-deoxy-alpha-D -glucopyranoside deacetylase [Isoptericola chiayiensis]|uniref:N-acetyl-1-D-myo-inositol-2-amino-2-deoxy-alpha-D -glucopyranoside deacetylase n=1 Tax=Isoptericola chiayiensis TaxID=579446 RepID=A0ABP8YJ70_9MICO
MTPSGRLLAVHAHPDDETLATGALLAAWAAAGEPVTVVTCTRGERGEVIDTASHRTGLGHLEGDGPALAAHREHEVAAALAALGVRDHLFLDAAGPGRQGARFEDSGMAWVAPGIAGPAADSGPAAFARVPLDDAAGRLAATVRDRRPEVVVTYEVGGGYGHPDHVRAHQVTVRALELAADPGAPVPGAAWSVPERWEVVEPAEALRAARRTLVAAGAPEGLTLPDPEGDLPPVAVARADLERATVRTLDVLPVRAPVLAALAAHATQVQAVRPLDGGGLAARYALSNAVLAPLAATAHLRVVTTSAPDTPVGSAR